MANAKSADTAPAVVTQEIVLADGSKIVVREASGQEVAEFLTGASVASTQEDTEEVMRQMVTQVFTATTAEEILGVNAVIHVKDYLDKPVTVLGVSWRKSSFVDENGRNADGKKVLPIFAIIKAVDANKRPITLTTGAFLPCAQMFHMERMGVLSDIRVKFIQRQRPTDAGFYPINLVAAD